MPFAGEPTLVIFRAVNFLLFQVGWFACALAAARGMSCTGPAIVAVIVVVSLAMSDDRVREVAVPVIEWGIVTPLLLALANWDFVHAPLQAEGFSNK